MHTPTFQDFPISEPLKKALQDLSYVTPSQIQQEAIPHILAGADLIGQSQTGTGKTAAFGIPLLEKFHNETPKHTQAIILCPTRELALQVAKELTSIGKYLPHLSVVPVYGGQDISRQITQLRKNPLIVVGTPGRVMDHMRRKSIDLSHISTIILDEADRMLDMGFRDDIEIVMAALPKEKQAVFFSATIPREMKELMKRYAKPDLVHISIDRTNVTAKQITQYFSEVRRDDKSEALMRILDVEDFATSFVFCNTKRMVDSLTEELLSKGYMALKLHGDMKQVERDRVMKRFKNKEARLLVATDVAARGIDVDDVDAVFNFDIPDDIEDYVHRIGRTGRKGQDGISISFISGRERSKLRTIERVVKTTLLNFAIPSHTDAAQKKVESFLTSLEQLTPGRDLETYRTFIAKKEAEGTNIKDLAALFLYKTFASEKKELGRVTDEGRGGGRRSRDRGDRGERGGRSYSNDSFGGGDNAGMTTLCFQIGTQQGIRKGNLVGAIAGETGIPGDTIGRIVVKTSASFVDVPSEHADKIMSIMKTVKFKGRTVGVRKADY